MGDYSDMVLDGILCQFCGVAIDGNGVGYPRTCSDCTNPHKSKKRKTKRNKKK